MEHIPVMLKEVIDFLDIQENQKYIDATLGGGGYTKAILQRGGEVLGLDQDPKSLERAKKNLSACPGSFKLINSNFSKMQKVAEEEGFRPVSGIVFDLGFASFQIEDESYGLSFLKDGPLDMRLDPKLSVTAADLLNTLPSQELVRLFTEYGEERNSWKIAQEIVKRRDQEKFTNTQSLVEVLEKVNGPKRQGTIHPATRVFQALRIAVNTEFENLEQVLPQALDLLESHGRLVIVSFHSGEDRIVKNFLKDNQERIKTITEKPIKPTEEEIAQNPRARSAILRVGEKL